MNESSDLILTPEERNRLQQMQQLQRLQEEVTELSANVRDLVEAWRTARGVVRFVKVLGGLATAMTAVWAMVTLAMGGKS